jgi:hypothetical protein
MDTISKVKVKIFKVFGAPLLSIIIGISFLPFLICYKCCSKLCCSCTKKNDYDHYEKNCDIFKIGVISCVILLSISVWIMLTLWLIQMGNMVGSLTKIMCTSVGVFTTLNEGISDPTFKFSGISGSVYLLQNVITDLDKTNKDVNLVKRIDEMKNR